MSRLSKKDPPRSKPNNQHTALPKIGGSKQVVYIVNGVGNKAQKYAYQEGDTVASILNRASIAVPDGNTVTLGQRNVTDPAKTTVNPGETLVIARRVSNG